MKEHKRERKSNSLMALLALTFLIIYPGAKVNASVKKIECETAFGEKVFTVSEQTIAFFSKKQGRSISSVIEATTKKTYNGFRKTLYINGNKHLINISNINNMNSDNDFMAVTSPQGHKMTYPLSCTQSL